MDKVVIIPTYNERENVKAIIESILALKEVFHVLIIDDASPDGTAEIVKALIPAYRYKLNLIERPGKLGLGTAYIMGFKWALERGYKYIFEMDADFSHNPADLERLYAACKDGADIAVGSRYVKGGAVKNWPRTRIMLSKGASWYTRWLLDMPVMDPTAGFVCYQAYVLKEMDLSRIQFVGYAFQIEMKYTAWKMDFRIEEVPITFVDRKYGVSKMNKGIIREGILGVIKLKNSQLY